MKKLLLLLLFVSSMFAQTTVAPIPNPKPQFFTSAGLVCGGCKVFTYTAGTVNPLQTYTDYTGSVQNTNPIILGIDGRPPQEIWLGALTYDIKLTTSAGAAIYTLHNLSASYILPVTLFTMSEGVCSGAGVGLDVLCADSGHFFKISVNNSAFRVVPQDVTFTSNTIPKFDSSGNLNNSGATDDGVTINIATEKLNIPGNLTQGTAALKNASGDHIIFVSPSGNDSNDGLSPGSAKLTSQAAIDTATSSGTVAGVVIFSAGSFSCPTTWRSNLTMYGQSSQYSSAISGTIIGGGLDGTTLSCTSGSNVTLTQIQNITLNGININFNNSGGGFVFNTVAVAKFYGVTISGAGSGTQDAVQMKTACNTGSPCNTAFNTFVDLAVETNTGSAANCITMTGQGVANAGAAVTDNHFFGVTCTGGLKRCLDFELNSDTNRFYGVHCNNLLGAAGDMLVFNATTPGSDQDADNETVDDICSTGAFTNQISMGQSFGNHVRICGGSGEVVPNILGGTPKYIIETTGLFGITPVLNISGTLHSDNLLSNLQFACTGTATASANLLIPVSSGACTTTVATGSPVMPVGNAGTVKNLFCKAITAGVNASSGAVIVRKNLGDQTLTCTFGTSTTCNDTTHSFTVVAGDLVDIRFTTQAAETLANVACNVQFR